MRLLIEKGADVRATGHFGDTALSAAAQKGKKLLLTYQRMDSYFIPIHEFRRRNHKRNYMKKAQNISVIHS